MSIVQLRKVTLCAPEKEKAQVLDALQNLGCLHLLPLRHAEETGEAGEDTEVEQARKALKYLEDFPLRRHQAQPDETFDWATVINRTLDNQHRTRQLSDRRDFLQKRIRELEPWGEFRFPSDGAPAGYRLWFYLVPHYRLRDVRDSGLIWSIVHRDSRYSYVVVAAQEEPPEDALPVPRTHTGALPLSAVRRRLARIEVELEELEAERWTLTRWIEFIQRNLARAADRSAARWARAITLDREGVFAVQGWVPVDAVASLRRLAQAHAVALEVDAPSPDDTPPTLLHNRELTGGGEEVVEFYQVPGYRNWDPSPVMFFSFALFFAMILSDAGYALLLGAVLWFTRTRLTSARSGHRIYIMGQAIVAASVVYGVLVGNYFGCTAPPGSVLGAMHRLDVNDFETMMRLSIVIGATHLVVANAATAFHRRWHATMLAPLGWVAIVMGGLVLGYGYDAGYWPIGVGALAVLGFASDRALGGPKDALLRLGAGMLALTGLTKAFGDVLSYLRLFALGLASASLAVTFNDLAVSAREALPGVGLAAFLLILVLGHGLNLVLAVVSGVVHGLRLNLIEFYHWGVPEGGYPFQPFEKKERKRWTT